MKTRHHTVLEATCPVNGQRDKYDVYAYPVGLMKTESFYTAVLDIYMHRDYQENITQGLANVLNCKIKTVGNHGAVRTTCVCLPTGAA